MHVPVYFNQGELKYLIRELKYTLVENNNERGFQERITSLLEQALEVANEKGARCG